MSDFIQMDIFFFITSLASLIVLFFAIIIGIYIVLIVYRVKKIVKTFEEFALYTTQTGRESIDSIKEKIEDTLSQGGIIERIVATALGTIIAKSFKNRGKIKKDVPKR